MSSESKVSISNGSVLSSIFNDVSVWQFSSHGRDSIDPLWISDSPQVCAVEWSDADDLRSLILYAGEIAKDTGSHILFILVK